MAPSSGGGPAAAAVNNSGSNISVAGSASASASHTRQHSSSLAPSLGEASGVAILLGNHAKFGLAERCCYHFDLIETLTSIPTGRMQQQQARARRRDRGLSVSSQEGAAASNKESGSSGGGSVQGNRDREASSASNANDKNAKPSSKNIDTTAAICGVVSLLECVSGGGVQADRTLKRSLRSKHREFNTRAQVAWGRSTRGTSSGALKRKSKVGSSAAGGGGTGTTRRCHQPRHLPLPLNTNTRVTFAYELTSIAIILDASPSLTSTFGVQSMMCDFGPFGEEKLNTPHMNDSCCVPLDSLGSLMKKYLQGLVQPIEVPPVAVSGLGVAFGRWKPNLAITVVAAYPPTSKGDRASAGLLVRDFRVTDDASALELASQIERWALREVESVIAERLSGERDFSGDGVGGRDSHQHTPILSPLGTFALPSTQNMGSWTQVKTSMKDLLAVGDAALSTLPPEGRPVLLVATDCRNVHCGGTFESLSDTSRCDVLLSVLSLSLSPKQGSPDVGRQESIQPQEIEHFGMEFSPSPLYVSDDSQPLRDMAHLSGGIFLDSSLLESYVNSTVGSPLTPSCLPQGDYHFSYKKRSIKPNGLQWYSLFTMSPFTPAMSSAGGLPSSLRPTSTLLGPFYRSSSIQSLSGSVSSAKQILGKPSELLNPALASSLYDSRTKVHGASYEERIAFAKYNISPVRIKSLLMTRVVEGYRARRYGHNTQDNDKVSVHLVLRLADCGIVLHYEASFVSSPYHIPTVGQAHVKIELSGNDPDFIQAVKKMFVSNHGSDSMIHGRRISPSSKLAAERICKFLRWTRKEDYLESYLCLPGWGEVNHFAPGSGFLGRLATLSKLQRYRHFRSETFEILTISPNYYEKTASIFSDVMEQNKGEDEMYSVLENWSNGLILNNRTLYFKEIIPPQEDDLAYYCIIRVLQSSTVSRLFTLTIDFHGELNAEQRLAVLSSLKESLRDSPDIVVLEKCISRYVAIRPSSPSHQWLPSWNEYFTHHKSWELLKDDEVLPLITKRRAGIGNFLLLQSDVHRGVFAKFVTSNEEGLSAPNVDVVIYQALSRADGIFVDIHMEACSSKFYPFHTRHSSTPFSRICENVRKRDKDCAKNIRSRTNLLTALDQAHSGSDSAIYHPNGTKQVEDVLRLMKLSRMYKKKLRFFNSSGSGTANDLLCRLTTDYITSDSFQTQCAKLSIDRNMPILRHSGSWFIMRVDWYVLSLACLELRDQVVQCEEGSLDSFRHLSFFTAGITDLYQSDDDVDDDKSLGDHSDAGSEHFGVSEIASDIESAHGKHFSRACYEALRSNDIISLENSEVTYALSSCRFLQIQWQTYVSVDDLSAHLASNAPTMTGTRLGAVIGNLVRTVPGSNDQVFFYHGAEVVFSNELIFRHPSSSAEHMQHYPIENDDVNDIEEETNINGQESDIPPPPLFFRFTLDRKLVSLTDILALKKSATLAAEVSVFKTTEKLPPSHTAVVSKLQNALNSFTSEQTIEKYRFVGRSLTKDMLEDVMLNLPKTKHKSCEMSVEFFMSRSNSMVAADNPTGNENDLEHAFSVLTDSLIKVTAKRASQHSFLVLDDSASRDVLPYWCFIQIQKPRGSIVVQVYHPLGIEAAKQQIEIAQGLVRNVCTRTNQLLLLDSLYKTKNASTLLIAEEEEPTEKGGVEDLVAIYSCPVQHKAAIPLHRRLSPQQAILALETTILQNFIVSNRRGNFVYKDESENVFYMKLNWFKIPDAKENDQNLHVVELLVYGCDKPGPSITDHLVCLLQRKVLTLTLDALSSLLKKNPWFNLLASDLAFIKTFSGTLKDLGHDEAATSTDCTRTYTLPPHVQDPLILLLMFRQNICGSTFIQHLHHEGSHDGDPNMFQVDKNGGKIKIRFNRLPEFQFYFNSSPSQLDPNYQPVTTLTEKGREYSRQAGSGIAIIDVNLCQGNNSECEILVGQHLNIMNNKLNVKKSHISLCSDNNMKHNDQFKIRVEIINTTVDADVIHKWVALSLTQVLAAWSVERHLDSSRLGLLRDEQEDSSQHGCNNNFKPSKQSKMKLLNKALPGFQAFYDMIRIGSALPHPAMHLFETKGIIRATVLANLTLEHMESISSLLGHKKTILERVDIIRYTDSFGASLVSITKENTPKYSVRVEQSGTGKVLRDQPTDSPEYIIVFGLNSGSQKISIESPQILFFRQVVFGISTQMESSTFSQALSQIKKEKPSLFQRHLVLILRISRDTRAMAIYNANPQLRSKLALKFKEIEQTASKADERHLLGLQSRCLRHISFLPNDSTKKQTTANEASTDVVTNKPLNKPSEKKPAKEEATANRGPKRRIPRPTSMLRPTLIGKSVEGAAMSAVAASRLRASTRPSVPQRTAAGSGKKKPIAALQREKTKDKSLLADRRVPAPQRKKRDSVAKDATSIVRTSTPQASLLKSYRAFLSLMKEGPELFPTQHRLNQSALQHLAHTFLMCPKDKVPSLIPTRLICNCYSNFLGTGSIQQLKCDSEMASAMTFAKHLTKCWGAKMIVSTNTQSSQLLYLQKDLLTSKFRRAVILIEASVAWDSFRNSFIFGYNAWLINSTDKARSEQRSRKPFASIGSIERETALIEAVALDFIGQLNVEQELFRFACLRVARIARGVRGESGPGVLSLLKALISRYSVEDQEKLPSSGYRLQRKFLSPLSFLDEHLLDSCKNATLIEHLLSNCQEYSLAPCGSGDDVCFSGRMKIAGFLVHYFIAWHESVESALDVFILCVTKGQCIDAYITKEGSPYAERVLDVVLYSGMSTVQEIIENASKAIRKMNLWRNFGKDYSTPLVLGAALIDSVAELRAFSHHLDLVLIDSRLEILLCDELNELQISWREVFITITGSSLFSHCITFDDEVGNSNYLVYCQDNDVFLDFVVDRHGRVQEAQILVSEQFVFDKNSDAPESTTAQCAVRKFTLFLLQWIWIDCETSF